MIWRLCLFQSEQTAKQLVAPLTQESHEQMRTQRHYPRPGDLQEYSSIIIDCGTAPGVGG
jgi:hypothetical protein